jgi:hypothetical protein
LDPKSFTHKDPYNFSQGTNRMVGISWSLSVEKILSEAACLKDKDHDAYLITGDTDFTELQSEIHIKV